ncbi:MAG: methyltransferase [Gemmatimonadetes bacterium]|nr:methyltransferase [Gemmatimonadota bacterium]
MSDSPAGPVTRPLVEYREAPIVSAAGTQDVPILLEPRAAFDVVRALLVRASYDEPSVARRLGRSSLIGAPRLVEGRKTLAGEVTDVQAALIRLFIDGESMESTLVQSLVGDDAFEALRALGLVRSLPGDDRSLAAAVALVPLQGLWFASDLLPRSDQVDGTIQDYVYGASGDLTGFFLSVIPDAPGAHVLELCAGTGVAALRAAARGAAGAVASDLVGRCVHFARFNVLLNALDDRVRVVQSDVWESIGDETFDLVVAHPPYVPALAHVYDFRDAGADGEHVTRRIVQGAPAHVRRGGRLIVRAALSDRRGATIAQRVREWLGESESEFDLVQLESSEYGPFDAYQSVTKGGKDFVDCERWMRHFDSLQIERFSLVVIELRREAYGRAPVTERRTFGASVSPEVADWTFRWGRFLSGGGDTAASRMVGQMPRVVSGVRAAVHLESQSDGGWATVGATVEAAWPSHAVVKAPPLAPTLLELCDGTRDVEAILSGLRSAGLVDALVGAEDVARLVEVLAAAAAIELPACRLPPRAVTQA